MGNDTKKLVINIGATDIAEGRSLTNVICLYKKMLNECKNKGIQVVATTIPAIFKNPHTRKNKIVKDFNAYIRSKVALKFPTVDLYNAITDVSHFHNMEIKRIWGTKKQVGLWSRLGVQRVYQMLSVQLGLYSL